MAENKSRVLKAVKIIVPITAVAVLAAIIALTVYIMICSASGKVAEVFGISVLKVVSGSMEPSISEGDYIIVRKTDSGELKSGDIICFYSKDSKIYGMPNTHRIVSILPDGSFITKGDANKTEDDTAVSADMIIGRYEGKSRFLRLISSFSSVNKLILLVIIVLMSVAAIYEVRTVAKVASLSKKEKERKKEEEKQRLIREAIDKEKEKLKEQGYVPEIKDKSDDGSDG